MLIEKLSKLVENSGLTQAEFEAISYRLSPQQQRLFLHLSDHGETDTITLRTTCSIGNISDVAISLNKKLTANEDPRKVICLVKPNINKFDDAGVLGHWLLVGEAANDVH
tara:strand:- start:2249 stop:2578 length:330 start_codon:yes stop_codon:yes gene_type:complete